jgi:serine phosphatase RsbU (regulator of sigma subunit)
MGVTRRRWSGFLLIWLAISLPFVILYFTSRRVILNEVRQHAMGVSVAVAASLNPADLAQIAGPEDMGGEAFRRVHAFLDQVARSNPEVRYLYVMRRSREAFAPPHRMEYVVDHFRGDFNGDGVIDRDEESELPGAAYDASALPEMQLAWQEAAADYDITPDPPYPDLISGYAPVRDAEGRTVAIVGSDITAGTVRGKLLAVQIVMTLVWIIMAILISLVIFLYYQQQDAFDRVKELSEELARRNEMLRNANAELALNNERYEQELKLAQTVQMGFLPRRFPSPERILFDKYYLTCSILGGDLFDAFDLDDDRVALFMADVAGHGVSAALISGLLKMAISSVRENSARATSTLYADLAQPDRVLKVLNDMLVKELPEAEFITMLYAVIDLGESVISFANAGHPWPVHYEAASGRTEVWVGAGGIALGIEANHEYPVTTRKVETGDRFIVFTDGVTEAMNAQRDEFGEARLLNVIRGHGKGKPSDLIAAICAAVGAHRGSYEVSDDVSILVAEIR